MNSEKNAKEIKIDYQNVLTGKMADPAWWNDDPIDERDINDPEIQANIKRYEDLIEK